MKRKIPALPTFDSGIKTLAETDDDVEINSVAWL